MDVDKHMPILWVLLAFLISIILAPLNDIFRRIIVYFLLFLAAWELIFTTIHYYQYNELPDVIERSGYQMASLAGLIFGKTFIVGGL